MVLYVRYRIYPSFSVPEITWLLMPLNVLKGNVLKDKELKQLYRCGAIANPVQQSYC